MSAVVDTQRLELEHRRVSGIDEHDDLPCEWCGEVKTTTVGEIWCGADPAGRLVRLCWSCLGRCAAG